MPEVMFEKVITTPQWYRDGDVRGNGGLYCTDRIECGKVNREQMLMMLGAIIDRELDETDDDSIVRFEFEVGVHRQ